MFDLKALDRAEDALCKQTGHVTARADTTAPAPACPVVHSSSGKCPVAHGGGNG
ncbi:MAG: hypothetical protein ACPGID_09295 [Rubricella sp.]